VQRAPLLGEHTIAWLTELGLSEQQIAELETDGVIGRALGSAKRAAVR
jgi:crotonobetainyl-CoA:carnitine CoA-transferase CaiB-like acyl-CoA transferase